MMFKKFYIGLVSLIVFTNLFVGVTNADDKSNKSAIIIYDDERQFLKNEDNVNHLSQLLYAFNASVAKKGLDEYKSGELSNYDSVFVINISDDISNNEFLKDLTNYNKSIYWIGDNVGSYLDYSKKYEISYKAQSNNINKLIYRDEDILVESGLSFNIINPSKSSKTIATISDGFNSYPYIINEKNLYYISRWDIGKAYIFEDSLNDFYGIKDFKDGEVFVRIEDVHPFRETDKLKEIADYLYSKNIPFMIALIPTYVDYETKVIHTLDKFPEFIEAIKYMQNKGGTVILHGYTHQIGDEEISGEGYEFWDIKNDCAVEGDIEVYIRDRILSGLRLCIENGIYPLGFEAPHYAMNIDGYKVLKQYFSTYVGQFQNNNESFVTSTFPYRIKNSDTFNILIPENLGFIEEGDDLAVDKIKANFEKISMVRGYTGGFFYHPYMDINYLKECITYLKDNDVKFIDLKSEDNYINIDDINIESKNGNITYSFDEDKAISKPIEIEISKFDKTIKSINDVVIGFIVVVLILFFIIFVVFRKINNNKFKRR